MGLRRSRRGFKNASPTADTLRRSASELGENSIAVTALSDVQKVPSPPICVTITRIKTGSLYRLLLKHSMIPRHLFPSLRYQ